MNVFLHTARINAASFVWLCCLVFAPTALATPVIVDVIDGTSPAKVAAKHGIVPEHVFTEVANGFTADLSPRQIQLLEADPDVRRVTADRIAGRIPRPEVRLLPAPEGDAGRRPKSLGPGAGPPPSTIPAQFPQVIRAGMRRIRAPLSLTAAIDGIDDRRVDADIAILDGGVDPYHPDLNVVGGVDCVRGPEAAQGYYDRDGHGTFVAGVAAAIDNAIGLVGVAPGARIWAVRVADPGGYVTDAALLCGLEYVARNRKIDIANISLAGENIIGPCREDLRRGSPVTFDETHQSVCRLVGKGVTVVAAAGNSAADAQTFAPAAYDEVITVSAIADFDGLPGGLAPTPPQCHPSERDDYLATFSNHGSVVDIAAPGVCVASTLHGGRYATAEGTSFSAPMAAGAAALLHVQRPGITPELIRRLIIDHAEPGPILGDSDGFSEGVLDVSSF